VRNRSHTISAEVEIPPEGAEGVLLADGGRFGGYSLYVKGGKLSYAYNFLGRARWHFHSETKVSAGRSLLQCSFEKTGDRPFGAGGVVKLYINGKIAGEGKLPFTVPFIFALGQGLQCGRDKGNPVTEEYASPFAFTGKIRRVIVDLSGAEPPEDLMQELEIALARQ
jgi:arylsulfatase